VCSGWAVILKNGMEKVRVSSGFGSSRIGGAKSRGRGVGEAKRG